MRTSSLVAVAAWLIGSLSSPAVAGAATPGWASQQATPAAGPAYGSYAWPVAGPVIRGYIAPVNQYSAGHRGIDIAAPFGTPVHAALDGTVAFAGWVGGSLYVSIDHADGVRTTYSWLSATSVKKGQSVRLGDVIGSTGHGHPEITEPHLHFGARVGTTYLDPMLLLGAGSVVDLIRLAPVLQAPAARRGPNLLPSGRHLE